jgi:tRNA-2-methylthio-N6-dimethylallyladenosine synthase
VALSGIHNANTAIYSPRQQTPAALWHERGEIIPEAVKEERLQILNEAIRAQSLKANLPYHGQAVEVLVEGGSKRNPDRLTGRTRNNKVVNFDPASDYGTPESRDALIGRLVPVRVTETLPFSLIGVMEE